MKPIQKLNRLNRKEMNLCQIVIILDHLFLLRFRNTMEFIITTLSIPVEDIGIITTLLLLYMKWMTMPIPSSNQLTFY